MKLSDVGEIGFIKRAAARFKYDGTVVKGTGDDAAVLKYTKDKYLLLTCDLTVEDVHFDGKAAPEDIGWKALCRNISDIAAMGGVPKHALVAMAAKPGSSVRFLDGIVRGMARAARIFGVNIVGGDMSRSEKLVIDVSLTGEVEKKNLVLRSGAKPGDVVFVTGGVGGSLKGKHLSFMPRLREARELVRRFKLSSMIDVSDGLEIDMWRTLQASSVGCRLYQTAIPLSKDADSFESAIQDGEDFELLFTMRPAEARRFLNASGLKTKTPVTMIGEIRQKSDGFRLVAESGKERTLDAQGFRHF